MNFLSGSASGLENNREYYFSRYAHSGFAVSLSL